MPQSITYQYKVISGKTYNNLAEWKADYNGGPTIPTELKDTHQHCSYSTNDHTMTRVVSFETDAALESWNAITSPGWGEDDKTLFKTRTI